MLSAYATSMIPDEGHHEWVDQIVDPFLKVFVFVAWDTAVEVEVSITNVAISNRHH